jgi:hypothetical protein
MTKQIVSRPRRAGQPDGKIFVIWQDPADPANGLKAAAIMPAFAWEVTGPEFVQLPAAPLSSDELRAWIEGYVARGFAWRWHYPEVGLPSVEAADQTAPRGHSLKNLPSPGVRSAPRETPHMAYPPFRRVQRGDTSIPQSAINGPQEALEQMYGASAPGAGFDFGQFAIPPQPRELFVVQITGANSSTPVKYSWQRMGEPVTNAVKASCLPWYDDIHGGPLYNTTSPPAYEINSNPAVPIGAVVELWPSQNGECLFFQWQPLGQAPPLSPPPPPGSGPAPAVVWGGLDAQGGIVTTAIPPPVTTSIVPPPVTDSTTYTFVTTATLPTGINTAPSPPLTTAAGLSVPPTPGNPLTVTITTTPGVDVYTIYQTTPTPGPVLTILYDPGTQTATATTPTGTTVTAIVTPPPTPGTQPNGSAHRSHRGRVPQPVPHRGPRHRPKLLMQLPLVPPGRIPPEGDVLVDRHQLAAVQDARPDVVHLVAAGRQGGARRIALEEGPEPTHGPRTASVDE